MVSYYFFFVFADGSELGRLEAVTMGLRERQDQAWRLREWCNRESEGENPVEERERERERERVLVKFKFGKLK